jgi:hypothetical protein
MEIEIAEVVSRAIWERWDNESETAWGYFKAFRELQSKERTVVRVAKNAGKKPEYLHKLAKQFSWVKRAIEYDRHKDAIQDKIADEMLMEDTRRRLEIARSLQELSLNRVKKWLEDLDNGLPVKITPADAARIAEIGIKLERMELGQSTENISVIARITTLTNEQLKDSAKKILFDEVLCQE